MHTRSTLPMLMRLSIALLASCSIATSCDDVIPPPLDPVIRDLSVSSELTICLGASRALSYRYLASGGDPDRVELVLVGDGTGTVDGADGLSREHRREEGEEILEIEGEFEMTCLMSDDIVLGLTVTLHGSGAPHVIERAITVHCVPCDGGLDGSTPADGGPPFLRPADIFVSRVLPDPSGDCADSGGEAASTCEPDSDQRGTGSEVEPQDQAAADGSFNDSTYECGEEVSGMRTVCSSAGVLPMPEGELVTILMDLGGPVPLASGDTSYVYAAVLDSDGDPANDFVPLPAFPWDYYQATDRWYELIYSHATGAWTVKVTQLDAAGARTEVASSVRAVIEGSRVRFFIARSELPARVPAYRTTSFRHDGMYTQSTRGGDVPFADPTRSLLPLGCDYTGVECGAGALADCGADHQCATEASRGVCIPMGLSACGGLLPECPSGQTCLSEGDAIGAPAYCVTDAMLDCICAAAAGRHVFPGCP